MRYRLSQQQALFDQQFCELIQLQRHKSQKRRCLHLMPQTWHIGVPANYQLPHE
jgi:hypothetical protein